MALVAYRANVVLPVKDDLIKKQGVLNVNIFRHLAAIVACLCLLIGVTEARAQSAGTNVVVLDVGRVFKEHKRFEQALNVMKKDVEAFEQYLRQRRTDLQKMAEELRTYKSGTPEYNQLEERIAKQTSDLQVETQLKRKEFMQREAKLYYNTYTEVTNVVSKFADRYGIQLVLRFNSEEIKPDDRASVLAGVNANVIFHKNRDITNAIIDEVNRGMMIQGRGGPNPPPIPR